MRFQTHVNTVKKVNRALYKIPQTIPRNVLNQIYFTYMLPYFDYFDTIYDEHLTIMDDIRLERFQTT